MKCKPGCVKCCLNTEMVLTESDVERLTKKGYAREYYAEYRNGYLRLKNVNGRCVFLRENGTCRIYKVRPIGCRLYPVIYDLDEDIVRVDEECPARDTISVEEFSRAARILLRAASEVVRSKNMIEAEQKI